MVTGYTIIGHLSIVFNVTLTLDKNISHAPLFFLRGKRKAFEGPTFYDIISLEAHLILGAKTLHDIDTFEVSERGELFFAEGFLYGYCKSFEIILGSPLSNRINHQRNDIIRKSCAPQVLQNSIFSDM